MVALLTVQLAVCAPCGDKDLTKEISINICQCNKVRSAVAAGKASERRVIHATDRQFSEVSWIGLRGNSQYASSSIGRGETVMMPA